VAESVRFDRYQNGHVISVPVRVGGSVSTRFILDTGIGLNIISSDLCRRLGFEPTGATHVGQRMSGQAISVPLTNVSSIELGSYRQDDALAGMLDLNGFVPPDAHIEGFLSPRFFEPRPFTLNPIAQTVRFEQDLSTGPPSHPPVEVPVKVVRDGPSVELFVDLRLPSGTEVSVEVDTGSDALILDTRFMEELGLRKTGSGVTKREGMDETGREYTRYFAQLAGSVSLVHAPVITQTNPPVIFQDIIYDGLVGDSFLKSYEVTYDLTRARLGFADPSK
jgi:hypothetical protein